jgi:hypothetical protein
MTPTSRLWSSKAQLETGQQTAAIRCIFWLSLRLLSRGEISRANGRLARAKRMLGDAPDECAEHGYLMLPLAEQCLARGDAEAAHATAPGAIGERWSKVRSVSR